MNRIIFITLLILISAACKMPDRNNPADPGSLDYSLDPPVNFTASDGIFGSYIELTWDAVEGADSYSVFRKKGDKWFKIGICSEPSYQDSSVENNTEYEYCVTAVYKDKSNTMFSDIDTGYCILPAPEVSCTRGASSDSITISWKEVEGADRYVVFREISQDGDFNKGREVTDLSYTDSDCVKGIRYWYRVKARKGDYLQSISDPVWGCTKLSPPAGVTASCGSGDYNVTVSCSAVKNAQRYRIYLRQGDTLVLRGESTATTFHDETDDTDQETFLEYYVTALTADDESESVVIECASGLSLQGYAVTGTSLNMNRLIYNTVDGVRFVMGDPDTAAPVHTVIMTRSYFISTTEVTWSDWCSVTLSDSPYRYNYTISTGSCGNLDIGSESQPVTSITWYDALLFCNLLSQINGLDPCYYVSGAVMTEAPDYVSLVQYDTSKNGYRLPTEAEWEYACRSLSSTSYYWGNGYLTEEVSPYAWFLGNAGTSSYEPKTKAVASKIPNSFGLYDMSGNAAEWVFDSYNDYDPVIQVNPISATGNYYRVVRGGSSLSNSAALTSAFRGQWRADELSSVTTFRIARNNQ